MLLFMLLHFLIILNLNFIEGQLIVINSSFERAIFMRTLYRDDFTFKNL